jgi:hypothetical protein
VVILHVEEKLDNLSQKLDHVVASLHGVCLQDKYPMDVTRQIRLLRQYKMIGRLNEAYDRAVKVDVADQPNYARSLEWFQCLYDILTVETSFCCFSHNYELHYCC